jgi:hypothetical protein
MVDTENNYLVTEAQLKRRGVEAEPFNPDYSSDALRVIGECIMNGKNNLDK